MNTSLLKKHIDDFLRKYKDTPKKFIDDLQERKKGTDDGSPFLFTILKPFICKAFRPPSGMP